MTDQDIAHTPARWLVCSDNVQAAAFFTRVAECYSGDGFFLKAVALYKQVLRLNPELVEVKLRARGPEAAT